MGGATGAPREGLGAPAPVVLGKFAIVEQIGEGGMARIYLARTRGIGGFEKLVVVKQILPRLAEDAEFIARFFQEARLAATLDHPNIAAVYDVDHVDGAYFYSMAFVRGRDLQKVARRAGERARPLGFAEIVTIVTGLCAGLHHAHTRADPQGRPLGIVHRDVSPSNVLLSFEGAVKVTDFGVAKARTGMISTVAGTLRGKIPYMSPEQCEGEALDRRSDVYAIGVLLWELVTGERLHRGDGEIAILRQIADRDAPSPRTLRPDCPAPLERIVAKALARRPADRYQSADALRTDLEEFARTVQLSVSGRAIAELMGELFDAEEQRYDAALRTPPTVPIALASAPSGGDATPPTGTLAPAASGPAAVVSDPAAAGRPVTWTDAAPPRRRLGGLAVGVVIGVVLGGGGLYFASADRPEPSSASSSSASPPATAAAVRPEAPALAPHDAARAPQDAALAPEARPADAAPSPVVAEPAAVDPEPARPPTAEPGRRKTKRRRPPPAKRAIDLDSALPPGFGDG